MNIINATELYSEKGYNSKFYIYFTTILTKRKKVLAENTTEVLRLFSHILVGHPACCRAGWGVRRALPKSKQEPVNWVCGRETIGEAAESEFW